MPEERLWGDSYCSDFDESVMEVLLSIKADADQKVYDRNDILKKDAYFEQTVMTLSSVKWAVIVLSYIAKDYNCVHLCCLF